MRPEGAFDDKFSNESDVTKQGEPVEFLELLYDLDEIPGDDDA